VTACESSKAHANDPLLVRNSMSRIGVTFQIQGRLGVGVLSDRVVIGYRCARCGEQRGFELRTASGSVAGWMHRIPEARLTSMKCSECGRDVPRDRWIFEKPPKRAKHHDAPHVVTSNRKKDRLTH